jgi:hypothetical protein
MQKQLSRFAMSRNLKETGGPDGGPEGPDFDDPRIARAMAQMERDMEHLDENNPRHMAHMMRKMNDLMPPGALPKEFETAIKRLEAGEDPEKIEADMGDVFGDMMDSESGRGGYAKDDGLYDY